MCGQGVDEGGDGPVGEAGFGLVARLDVDGGDGGTVGVGVGKVEMRGAVVLEAVFEGVTGGGGFPEAIVFDGHFGGEDLGSKEDAKMQFGVFWVCIDKNSQN